MQKKGKDRKNPWSNGPTLLLIAMCLGSGLYWFFNREPTPVPLKYGELAQILKAKDPAVRFRNVRVGRSVVTGEIDTRDIVSDGKAESARLELTRSFRTSRQGVEQDAEFIKLLKERVGREFQGEEEESALRGVYSLLMSFVLIVAVVLVGFLLFRWIAGGNSPLTFGRSRHKLYAQKDLQITFKDVAGIDEAVAELREIVDFLKSPEKYQALGGRIPKGVLLVGPPGTGKTLLAKAVAGEADVPFFSLSGSDFVEMFVGVGASRVRDLFGQAESKAPCLTGDTLVTLAGGRQVTIREMFEKDMLGVRVPAMTEDFRLKEATVIGITRKPCVDLYKITTSTSAIKATGNHLFPVLRGSGLEWVRADQLSNTDYVAVPRHIRRAANAPVVTDLRLLVDRAHPGVLWSRIRCVQRVAPVDYVYDLCLDRHHCFVSNNIITHNCIVFIDELDALGKTRGGSAIGGHDEREQTLNQLLVEMDGFDSNRGVILMAATNRPETLDAALMRPGRFDRTVVVDRPDVSGREAILKVHARNVRLGPDVDLRHVARLTPGSAGADLANLVNEAALLAARAVK
ncbi:MAG TPA: AAA family ATPase, partial [Gemmataceae bacterium]|nr:AAA family ATPase [Gemmataceae bacterium]